VKKRFKINDVKTKQKPFSISNQEKHSSITYEVDISQFSILYHFCHIFTSLFDDIHSHSSHSIQFQRLLNTSIKSRCQHLFFWIFIFEKKENNFLFTDSFCQQHKGTLKTNSDKMNWQSQRTETVVNQTAALLTGVWSFCGSHCLQLSVYSPQTAATTNTSQTSVFHWQGTLHSQGLVSRHLWLGSWQNL